MPSIADIKQQYPDLIDLDDNQVVDAVHEAFYRDMPRDEVAKSLGVKPAPAPVEPRGNIRAAGDLALSLGQGATGAVKALTDLAGAQNFASRGLGNVDEFLQDQKSEQSKATRQNSMERIKIAEGTGSTWEEAKAYMGMLYDQPGEMLAQGVGSFVTLGLGKAAQALKLAQAAKAAGVSKQAFLASEVGKKAAQDAAEFGFKANIGVGAGMGIGAVKGSQYEQTFNNAKAKGMSNEEAAALATKAQEYGGEGTAQQLLGGGLGALASATGPIERVLIGKGAGEAGQNMAMGMGKGFAVESMTEGGQGAQERYAGNVAAIDAGVLAPENSLRGVVGQGLMEGAVGGVIGGGMGAFDTQPQQPAGLPNPDITEPAAPAAPAAPVVPSGPLARAAGAVAPGATESIAAAAAGPVPVPVDDPVADTIRALPVGVKQQALRAYAMLNNPNAPKGVRTYNQKLLDGLLEQVAGDAQAGLEKVQKDGEAIDAPAPAATEKIAPKTTSVDPSTGEITSAFEQRQADAPKQQPDDILNAQNQPFTNMGAAKKTAQALGDGFVPFKLGTNAFVVRKRGEDDVGTSTGVSDVAATAGGSGAVDASSGLGAGAGNGNAAVGAVVTGDVRAQPAGAVVSGADRTDDKAVDVQNAPPATAAKTETTTSQAPEAGAPAEAGTTAAGASGGSAALEADGVNPTTLYRGVRPGRDAKGTTDTVGGALFYTPDRAVAEAYAGKGGTVIQEEPAFKNTLFAINWMQAKESLGLPQSATMEDMVKAGATAGYDSMEFTTSNGREIIALPMRSARSVPKPTPAADPMNVSSDQQTSDAEAPYTGPTAAEVLAIQDVPTTEKMTRAMAAVGDREFENQVTAKFAKYKPTSLDQQAMLVEATAIEILALQERKNIAQQSIGAANSFELGQDQRLPPVSSQKQAPDKSETAQATTEKIVDKLPEAPKKAGPDSSPLFSRKSNLDTPTNKLPPNEANREKTDKLQQALNRQGYDFTITPVTLPVDTADNGAGRPGERGPSNSYALAERIAELFGKKVVWFESEGPFAINGVVIAGGELSNYIFIRASASHPAHVILGHELSHHMEKDAPGVYKALVKALTGLLKNHNGYRQKYDMEDASDADIVKEMIGDIMGDNFGQREFWNRVSQESDGLHFKMIARSVMKWLDTLLVKLRLKKGFGSEQFVSDVKAAREALAQAMIDYAATKGNPALLQDGSTAPTFSGTNDSMTVETPAFSRKAQEAQALKALSENDELFALPKSEASTVEEITAENDPPIKVKKTLDATGRTDYQLTLPNGKTANLIVRPFNPYATEEVPTLYGFDLADGEMTNLVRERPGTNPEDVGAVDDVWIDASSLDHGSFGAVLYNIAATYAKNTGRKFIGDPAGLSDDALRRRTEQMLSSALKFGTTEHLAPHPRQVRGDKSLGIPPLEWTYGDDLGNIRALVETSLANYSDVNPVTFEPSTGRYLDSEGVELDDGAIRQIGRLGRPAEAGAGLTTLKRNAVLNALVREEGGSRGGRGQRNGLLGALVELAGQSPASTRDIFYSRGESASGDTNSVEARAATAEVERIVQGITSRWANAPEVVVVFGMTDERIPSKVRAQDIEQRSGGAAGDPEGFYLGGKAYILASQVSTPQDIARVLFHESLGHFGLRHVFGDQMKPLLAQLAALRRADVMAKANFHESRPTPRMMKET